MSRRFICTPCELSIDVPAGQKFVCPKCGGPMESFAIRNAAQPAGKPTLRTRHKAHKSPSKGVHKRKR